MPRPRITAIATVIVLVWSVLARAGDSVEIGFRFEDGAKSKYDISLDFDVTNTVEMEGQKISSSSKTGMKLVMDTTVRAADDAAPELAVKFSGLEVDQTITDPSGEVKVEIRGRDVKVEKDSRYVVNTYEGLGEDLARGLLAEFGFLGREGALVMDRRGRVTEVRGPKEFRGFLAASSGPGLFVLEAPEGRVPDGGSWESEGSEVKRLKGLDLSPNPLVVRTSYTLEGVEEKDGRKIAKILVKSGVEDTDISARASTEAVEERHANIEEIKRAAAGTVLFDLGEGIVVESDLDVTLSVKMKIKHDEDEVGHEMTGRAKVRTKLAPAVLPPAGEAESAEPEAKTAETPAGGSKTEAVGEEGDGAGRESAEGEEAEAGKADE